MIPEIDDRISPFLTLDLSGTLFKLDEVQWFDPDESGGKHHIFIEVLDENGERMAGQKLLVSWPGAGTVVTMEEKPGDPWGANYPMYATLGSYTLEVVSLDGTSDKVSGFGMGTPSEPDVKHHTSFGVTFRRLNEPEPEPTPEPEPEPEPVDKWELVLEKLDTIISMLEERLDNQ